MAETIPLKVWKPDSMGQIFVSGRTGYAHYGREQRIIIENEGRTEEVFTDKPYDTTENPAKDTGTKYQACCLHWWLFDIFLILALLSRALK